MTVTDTERDLILEIVSDDDRPTFILESKPGTGIAPADWNVVFLNIALKTFIGESEADLKSFHSWAGDIFSKSPPAGKTHHVGVLGDRDWSSNKLKCGWILVHCRKHNWHVSTHDDTPNKPSTAYFTRVPDEEDTNPLSEMPLTSIRVDWILHSDLNTDPWPSYLRNFDWAGTTLGPMDNWPACLRARVITIMACQEPRVIFWGDEMVMIYNAAVIQTLGKAHPASLGKPFSSVWGSQLSDQHKQTIRLALKQGKATPERNELIAERNGKLDETYYDLQMTPLTAEDGQWCGALAEYTEVTSTVYQANRGHVITSIENTVARTESLAKLWSICMSVLEAESQDVVYGIVYSLEDQSTDAVLEAGPSAKAVYKVQTSFGLDADSIPGGTEWFEKAQGSIVLLQSKSDNLPNELAITVTKGVVCSAYVIPVASAIGATVAYVVLGINPRRPIEESMPFADSLQNLFERSVTEIQLPEDRARMEQANLLLLDQLRSSRLKLEKNEEAFVRMGKSSPAGMFIFSADAQPIYVNQAYLDIFGLSMDEFYENAKTEFIWGTALYQEDHQSAKDLMMKVFVGKEHASFEYRLVSPPNSIQRWMDGTIFPEMDDDGNVTSFQGWVSDISHRKLAESIKEERLKEAIEHKRAAEKFLDMISHEIRNPLSSILLLADEILAMVPQDVTTTSHISLAGEAVHSIIDAARTVILCASHQQKIVDDVLTLSKLDSRLFSLDFDRVQAPVIIDSGVRIMAPNFAKARIESSVEILQSYDELGLHDIFMDSGRIKQVFINLLSNACKFTKPQAIRKITVTLGASFVRPTGETLGVALFPRRAKHPLTVSGQGTLPKPDMASPTDEVYIHFSVKDTGCGIEENEIHNLFHKFSQASPRTHKQYGGSGLGLFISREFVELHGGQIGIQSTPSIGSTFAFYIKAYRAKSAPPMTPAGEPVLSLEDLQIDPAKVGESLVEQSKEPPQIPVVIKPTIKPANTNSKVDLNNLHVLVVEDNPVNQKVLSRQLRRAGCKTVNVADNGLEALNFLSTTEFHKSRTPNSTPLSVILLDVEMPVMDGVTCIRRIRELERNGELVGHVPVIAVTANARQKQRDDVVEAGMDEVQTKPFKIPELIGRMQALVAAWT